MPFVCFSTSRLTRLDPPVFPHLVVAESSPLSSLEQFALADVASFLMPLAITGRRVLFQGCWVVEGSLLKAQLLVFAVKQVRG